MTPAEILEHAADVIDERGHYKGDYCMPFTHGLGAVCALGAIRVAIYGTPDPSESEVINHIVANNGYDKNPDHTLPAIALTRLIDPTNPGTLIDWNDDPKRTTAEITSTMRALALTLRAQSALTPEAVTA